MSNIAAKELVPLGYTNVLNLEGGSYARATAGYSMEKNLGIIYGNEIIFLKKVPGIFKL